MTLRLKTSSGRHLEEYQFPEMAIAYYMPLQNRCPHSLRTMKSIKTN